LKRINALAGALIDGALFVRHAHAWRGELNKSVGALLDQWAEEVIADFLERQLPVIEHANRDAVAAIYEDLIEQNVDRTPAQEELCVWRKRRKLLRALRETLCELEDES
jgi:hypothetical protein